MANILSTQRTAQVAAASNFASRIDDKRFIEGVVQFAHIDCPVSASEVAGNTIDLIELPEGAQVIPELSNVLVTDVFGATALTLDIGDSTVGDRYSDGLNALALGQKNFVDGTAIPAACVTPIKVSGTTCLIKAKIATSTTPAAGHFRVTLAYKCL